MLLQTDRYTIRGINTDDDKIAPETWSFITESVSLLYDEIVGTKDHLFITVVAADHFDDGEGNWGLGVYHEGIQHVAITGLEPDLGDDVYEQPWRQILFATIAHEIIHFKQDLDGVLSEYGEDLEEETESRALEITEELLDARRRHTN